MTAESRTTLRYSRHCTIHRHALATADEVLAAVQEAVQEMVTSTSAGEPVVVVPVEEELIRLTGEVDWSAAPQVVVAAGPSPALCRTIDDKWECQQLLESAALPVIDTAAADDDRARVLARASAWPDGALVKPRLGAGGRGIVRCRTVEELDEALEARRDQLDRYIVQEFIAGEHVGCNLLAVDGQVVLATSQVGWLDGVPDGFTTPVGLDVAAEEDVLELAQEFAAATRWDGVANIDLRRRRGDGRLFVVEINPRYWQTLLGSLAAGVNFPHAHVGRARGGDPESSQPLPTRWADFHTITDTAPALRIGLRNVVAVRRATDWHVLALDPAYEAVLLADKLRRIGISGARRTLRRPRRAAGAALRRAGLRQ
ncbi:ATP-grasp domain-containing protein [Luteimicrobium album]|uniref:ATP-grasp domain-containing protein n=1 Tax=Luteimicrobium album TaxID=1054550 RepID=UPI0024E0CB4E|nr:ATP-grasp domain-containing protein [Luteimicrobium album]